MTLKAAVIRRTITPALAETFQFFCDRCEMRVVEADRIEIGVTYFRPHGAHFTINHTDCPTWRIQ